MPCGCVRPARSAVSGAVGAAGVRRRALVVGPSETSDMSGAAQEPRKFAGVMVSSTYSDLAGHRAALIDLIEAAGFKAVVMEPDSAKPGTDIIDSSLAKVRDAAALVVMISHRYGQTPECARRNPNRVSISELEFEEAIRLERPIVLFLMGDDHPVTRKDVESDDDKRKKLQAFRERAKRVDPDHALHRIYATFESLDDFKIKAGKSVSDLRALLGDAAPPVTRGDPIAAYRSHVAAAHARLVPFAPEMTDKLLKDAAVQLDVESEGDGMRLGAEDGRKPAGESTLRSLIEQSIPKGSAEPMPRWLVKGDPGAGKTTIARDLVRRLAEVAIGPIPIFTSVTRLVEKGGDVALVACDTIPGDPGLKEAVAGALRSRLVERGAVWVFLDGYDEVPAARRGDAWSKIQELASGHPAVAIVVMSRPIAFEQKQVWPGFGKAHVLALDDRRQRELATRLVGEAAAHAVARVARDVPRLGELARNPLLLTLMSIVVRDALAGGREIPAGGGRLFDAAIELLLGRGFGLESKAVKDVTAARELLQALSLALHRREGEAWWPKELSGALWDIREGKGDDLVDAQSLNFRLKETWTSNDGFLDDIAYTAGIVSAHDGPGERWRYMHRALREFLAAERLQVLPKGRADALFEEWTRTARAKGRDEIEKWAEVFQFHLALSNAPASKYEELKKVSEGLAARAVRGAEHIAADDRLRLALEAKGPDAEPGRDLLLAARAHPEPDVAAKAILELVKPTAPVDLLGRLHWVLDSIGRTPDRGGFFDACGRPVDRVPKIEFRRIAAGRFKMGSPEKERDRYSDEGPAHDVTLRAFDLATTTVTAEQWSAFERGAVGEPRLPATRVSWWASRLFCAWIGARLPSESEWEYACRAGTSKRWSCGDDEESLLDYAWVFRNSGKKILPVTTKWDVSKVLGEWGCSARPVATKKPNPWGLFDMHGNVWEWCEDTTHASYAGAPSDGSAWVDPAGGGRVIRGGSWSVPAGGARSAYRGRFDPWVRDGELGFRPARSVPTV